MTTRRTTGSPTSGCSTTHGPAGGCVSPRPRRFFYRRAAGRNRDGAVPAPLIDASARHPRVWSDLGQMSLQVWTFDPAGMALRASTRAYQGNVQNEQKAPFEQAL